MRAQSNAPDRKLLSHPCLFPNNASEQPGVHNVSVENPHEFVLFKVVFVSWPER